MVYAELARIFETRTTAEWTELLDKADVPVMPMHDLESILQDPHLVATDFFPVVDHPSEGPIRNMKVSATWSETPAEPTRLAPRLNEHGAEILREAGFSADEIAALVRDGVTKAGDRHTGLRHMDFALTANQESIRDAVGKNLRAFRRRLLAEEGQGGRLPADFHKALADAGWLGICIPEAYGGSGLGITDAAIMMRTIAESGAGMSGRLRRAHERVRAQSRGGVRQ